jgi:preprotein translocase SecE subunit
MWSRIKHFFEEARTEFRHVNWPTRREGARLTSIVIGISLGLAVFLGFFDWLFTNIVKSLIIK